MKPALAPSSLAPAEAGRWTFWATAIPLVIVYHLTGARTVTGEDSGELVTAAWQLGVAHPPGTPIWVMVTWLFQHVFTGLSPAGAAAFASAVLTAGAMGFMAITMRELGARARTSVAAALITGLSFEIWNHATIAEVYPLNLFILAVGIHRFFKWKRDPCTRNLAILSLVYGCGLANHPTFALFLPVFGLGVLLGHPKTVLRPATICVGLLGLAIPHLAYLQVAIAAANEPYVSWGVEPNVGSVVAHYLRDAYEAGPAKTAQTTAKVWEQAQVLGRYMTVEFTLIGIMVCVFGLLVLLRRDRFAGVFVGSLVFIGTFGLLALLKFDLEREEIFAARVFLMPSTMILGLGLAFAAEALISRAPTSWRGVGLGLLFLAPVAQAISGWTDHDRTRYSWAEDYGRAILDPLPKDSVLLPGGDTSTFPLLYLQGVQGLRRDVLILDRSGVIERDAALALLPEDLRSDYAEASDGDLRQAIMVYSRRPVIVLRKEPLPPSSGRELVPLAMGFAVAANPTGEQREELRERQRVFLASLTLRNTEIPTVNDHTSDIIRSHVAQVRAIAAFEAGDAEAALNQVREAGRLCQGIKETLNNLGALLAENGHEEEALAYFQRALNIRGDYLLGRRNYVLTLRRMNRLKDALTEAARGLHLNPEDSLLFEEAAKAALELADGNALSRLCNRRTAIAPDDARPLRYLGLYALHKQGAILLAKSRFEAALAIDPKDRESREALDEINGRFGTNPGNVAASAPDVDPLKALSRHLKSDYVLDAGRNRGSPGDRLRESPGSLSPAQMPGGADFGRINAGGGQAHAPVTVPQAPVLGTPVQIRR